MLCSQIRLRSLDDQRLPRPQLPHRKRLLHPWCEYISFAFPMTSLLRVSQVMPICLRASPSTTRTLKRSSGASCRCCSPWASFTHVSMLNSDCVIWHHMWVCAAVGTWMLNHINFSTDPHEMRFMSNRKGSSTQYAAIILL